MQSCALAQFFPFIVLKDVIKIIKDEIKAKSAALNSAATTATTINTAATGPASPFAVDLDICSSVDRRLVSGFTDFAVKSIQSMGMIVAAGPSPQEPQIQRWTVLSSPFVHKTARTQFERRLHRQSMRIEGIWSEQVCAKLIWYLRRNVPNEIEMNITLTERNYMEQ